MQRKCYIIVVTQALVVCLICPPSGRPAALGLRVYISGRPLVPVLQLLHIVHTCYSDTTLSISSCDLFVVRILIAATIVSPIIESQKLSRVYTWKHSYHSNPKVASISLALLLSHVYFRYV